MSFIILIAGLPGTGKTSFAEYLSGKMKIPMVSKDIIKEHLFDTIGFKNRNEKVTLGLAAADLMYHFAELHLETGRAVILENNFETATKPGLMKLIEKYRCKTVMVKFYADYDVLAERFLKRDSSPERHRGHVINTRYPETEGGEKNPPESRVTDFKQYHDAMIQRGMAGFSAGGEEIPVDTTDFSKVSYEEIYRKIQALTDY